MGIEPMYRALQARRWLARTCIVQVNDYVVCFTLHGSAPL